MQNLWWQSSVLVVVVPMLGACSVTPDPVATFEASPVPSEPLIVEFDASASVPGAGVLKDYLWNYGDGTGPVAGRAVVSHRFPVKARYPVTLEVTDANLAKNTASRLVLAGNRRPTAVLALAVDVAFLGSRITLDGSQSTDDGRIDQWSFTIKRNEVDEPAPGPGPRNIVTYVFDKPGDFTVTLDVTDDDQERSLRADTRSLRVLETRAPDTEPPSIQISAPRERETVTAVVTVRVHVEDNEEVAEVEFLEDRVVFAKDREPPYDASWETTRLANGEHELSVRAFDRANNVGKAMVNVLVRNQNQ